MKDKEPKAYHITYDIEEDVCPNEEREDYLPSGIDELYVHSKPYLMVFEVGKTGKPHHHFYFYSKFCKNTLKKKFEEELKTQVYFSDPDNVKYKKYDCDGVRGVEIYLVKGIKNHMSKDDNIENMESQPYIVRCNQQYYDRKDPKGLTWLGFCRQKYEEVIKKMRSRKKEVADDTKAKNEAEIQVILKDLENYPSYSRSEIVDYLTFTHYVKPEYNFTDVRCKNMFWRILKIKNPNEYKNQLHSRIANICGLISQN